MTRPDAFLNDAPRSGLGACQCGSLPRGQPKRLDCCEAGQSCCRCPQSGVQDLAAHVLEQGRGGVDDPWRGALLFCWWAYSWWVMCATLASL